MKMKNLTLKYLTNTITEAEQDELCKWLSNPKNQKIFKKFVKDDYSLNTIYTEEDIEKAYNEIWLNILKQEKTVKRLKTTSWIKYAVAASIVLLISLTFILNRNNTQIYEPIIVNNNIKVGTDKATLTLEDGTNVVLEKGQQYVSDHLKSNGEALVYNTKTNKKPEVVYNYITTPRGGQYHVTLSDGTEVWLNSESKLKYPISFTEGKTREVKLVYGEAYFDVSPSTQHKGSIFKVLSDNQEIEVLGTEFNIKAYKCHYERY